VSLLAVAQLIVSSAAMTAAAQPPTLAQLKNATYRGIYDTPVTLKNGVFEGKPFDASSAARPRVELADTIVATGSIDGNATPDAAVILTENSGGSGIFHYLAVVVSTPKGVRNIVTVPLEDRVMLRGLAIRDRRIVLDLVGHGAGEPACCPTEKQRRTFTLEKGELVEGEKQAFGAVSLADLEGPTWTLVRLNLREPIPAGVKTTLQVSGNRVSGNGGCNRYSGAVTQGTTPRDITIGRTTATMMACVGPGMAVEGQFFKALEKVSGFTFLQGRLALTSIDDGQVRTLLFAADAPGGWK
jgi:heat shock protein HslJ